MWFILIKIILTRAIPAAVSGLVPSGVVPNLSRLAECLALASRRPGLERSTPVSAQNPQRYQQKGGSNESDSQQEQQFIDWQPRQRLHQRRHTWQRVGSLQEKSHQDQADDHAYTRYPILSGRDGSMLYWIEVSIERPSGSSQRHSRQIPDKERNDQVNQEHRHDR
jgi:hypothetical protein